jgi:hypothetical protein
LKVNPPHITDEPMIAQLKKIGIELGKGFDMDKADPVIRNVLASAPEDAQKLMIWKVPTLARVANGWSMNTDTMGVYGNYYLKRAALTDTRDVDFWALGLAHPSRRLLAESIPAAEVTCQLSIGATLRKRHATLARATREDYEHAAAITLTADTSM